MVSQLEYKYTYNSLGSSSILPKHKMNIILSYLILSLSSLALFSQQQATDSHEYSSIGIIIDNTSRAGREAKVSIEMALDDISNKTNQSFVRHIIDSQGEPFLAALAGKLYICPSHLSSHCTNGKFKTEETYNLNH